MDLALDSDMRFRKYYVLFRKAKFQAWWSVFTVSGLEHCSVVEEMNFGGEGLASVAGFIHIDHCHGLLLYRIHSGNAQKHVAEALAARRITLAAVIEVEKSHRWEYIPFGLFTCVTIVKSILGLHDWWVQTPQSLLRTLERQGAVIVKGL